MNTIEKLDIQETTTEQVAEKLNELIAQVNMLIAGRHQPDASSNQVLGQFSENL